MAQAEDERLFEENKSLSIEIVLVSKEVSFGRNGLRESRGPNRWVAVQEDVPRSSIGMNKYYKNKL